MDGVVNSDEHSFLATPFKPLLVAIVFKLFGVGIFQTRIVSVICRLADLATF